VLTLLGPGGIGKTRLGLQVATEMRAHFADGVCFVSLAGVTDARLVVPTVAQELGIQEGGPHSFIEQVKAFLLDRHLLLLLDNFEQVVSAALEIEAFLVACPLLKVVVTSRAALRLQLEYQYPLAPLSVPDLALASESDTFSQCAAVILFVQRAQVILPAFRLTPANARPIAEICIRLDGLSLAIELAAARVKLFPPQALLKRLSQPLDLLTGSSHDLPVRHRTLRDTLKWSYDLLDETEQCLFRTLSVFLGGWTLDAVEAVWRAVHEMENNGGVVLEGITSLLDKSLLLQVAQASEEPRLLMLETVREYGRECLRASGEAQVNARAHALYYLRLVQEAEPQLKGSQQLTWFARLEQEMANIFTALETAFSQGMHAELVQGINAFARFLEARGLYAQAELHLKRAQQVAASLHDHSALSTTLLYLGELAERQGDYPQAEAYLQEGLPLARLRTDDARSSDFLRSLGMVARRRGNYTQGEAYLQEALGLIRQLDDLTRMSKVLTSLGAVASERGNYLQAETYLQEGLTLARRSEDRQQISMLLTNLGQMALLRGNYSQAEAFMQEGLELAQQIGYSEGSSVLLMNLGHLASERKQYAKAEAYWQKALALTSQSGDRERIGTTLGNLGWVAGEQGNFAQAEAHLHKALLLARQIEHHWLITAVLNEWGELYLKEQRFDEAATAFGEAHTLASEGNTEYLALACYGLARIALAQGDTQEALRQGQESLSLLEEMGHSYTSEVRAWLDKLPKSPLSEVQISPVITQLASSAKLTVSEVEVLQLITQGLTNAQIAARLLIQADTVNAHVSSIFNKLVQEQQEAALERERVEQDLLVARRIQHSLLPKEVPAFPGWQIATHYQPAREVGGDFYDFFPFADGRLGLAIGDVSGKGIPAALVMATTHSILHAVAKAAASPGAVLGQTNNTLHPDIPPGLFVTCFYVIIDPQTGLLRYANAGHDLPYRYAPGNVAELEARGMPLGLLPDMEYEEQETLLQPGEGVILYSDGLVEAHNPVREMFGFPRLKRLLSEHSTNADLIQLLLEHLQTFTGPTWTQEDDITLVTFQRAPHA
jgi:serine phosphatase RsbU (regulator of sigma subunit)/predicted ATPase/Tfp pilus assembly protein PilF